MVAVLAGVAPAVTAFVRIRAELGITTNETFGSYLPGAAAGAALIAGNTPLITINLHFKQLLSATEKPYLGANTLLSSLRAGLWVLWPLARRGGWRRGSLAFCEGLFFGILATVMLKYLCWQFQNCL